MAALLRVLAQRQRRKQEQLHVLPCCPPLVLPREPPGVYHWPLRGATRPAPVALETQALLLLFVFHLLPLAQAALLQGLRQLIQAVL